MFKRTHLLTWLTFAPWVARKRAAASLPARAALCIRQCPTADTQALIKTQPKSKGKSIQRKKKGNADAPVAESGASALLPRWISWAAKLFSLNEVPFTTGASSSNGFTEASEDTVMYCRANHRAVLPSWSLSSRSSLSRGREVSRVTGKLEQLPDSSKGGAQLTVCTAEAG